MKPLSVEEQIDKILEECVTECADDVWSYDDTLDYKYRKLLLSLINHQTKLARINELDELYIYHPRQVQGIIMTDIGDTPQYYQQRIKQLQGDIE